MVVASAFSLGGKEVVFVGGEQLGEVGSNW
jgi:hypothetical protein